MEHAGDILTGEQSGKIRFGVCVNAYATLTILYNGAT